MKYVFDREDEAFAAFRKAQLHCTGLGFSVGSMQGPDPIGIVRGDYDVQKWRNLTRADRARLDGVITGDKRHGPVVVEVYERGERS